MSALAWMARVAEARQKAEKWGGALGLELSRRPAALYLQVQGAVLLTVEVRPDGPVVTAPRNMGRTEYPTTPEALCDFARALLADWSPGPPARLEVPPPADRFGGLEA